MCVCVLGSDRLLAAAHRPTSARPTIFWIRSVEDLKKKTNAPARLDPRRLAPPRQRASTRTSAAFCAGAHNQDNTPWRLAVRGLSCSSRVR